MSRPRRWLARYRAWSIGVELKRGPDQRREQILAYYKKRGWITSYSINRYSIDVRVSDRWRWGWTGPGLLSAKIVKRWDE